ncbi:nardilysin-like [Rosa rugosa]|uniref:nardilysin-like n=1 Tax=Rosa rugosa TaxID=74645 RepID=UPI002B40CCD2|nr:nardilysin-like [Rosa rugosa]
MGCCTFSSDDIVIKSPNDKRLYRVIKLENGLTALLNHDPQAAAAMCVGIGSFSDSLEAQGLAHFLEHMLFMGSTKFPDENEYASYLSKHGGSSNAHTEAEHTCYYFDVKREFLKGALKRFSQFFVSPLMKNEAMAREYVNTQYLPAATSKHSRLDKKAAGEATPQAFTVGQIDNIRSPTKSAKLTVTHKQEYLKDQNLQN